MASSDRDPLIKELQVVEPPTFHPVAGIDPDPPDPVTAGQLQLRDREERRPAHQESQRNLARGRVVGGGGLLEDPAPLGVRAGEVAVAERAVGDDRDSVLLAPGEHGVLDGAFLEMVEDLVAGDAACAGDPQGFHQVGIIEIAHAPGQDLPFAPKLLEGRECLLQRVVTPPVQEVAVQPVGLEARERPLAGLRRCGMPGLSLVVRDGRTGLLTNVAPCEDAYTNERACIRRSLPWSRLTTCGWAIATSALTTTWRASHPATPTS